MDGIFDKSEDTLNHITSGRSKPAQQEYKRRHDCVACALHWDLRQKHEIQTTLKRYECQPKGDVETDSKKMYGDFNMHTDDEIHVGRPDVVVHDNSNKIFITDVENPSERSRKIEKYNERIATALESQQKLSPL